MELLEEKKALQRAKQRIINIRKWRREVVRKRIANNAKVIYWAVRKLLPKRVGPDVIDDFAADLTVWVLEKAHQYDREKGSFSTWLHWQARAVLADRARKLARDARRASCYTESDFVEDVAEDRVTDVAGLMDQAEQNRVLAHRLIQIVPERERNVFKLFLDGKTFREISEVTKWSRQTISNRFAKLAKLARQAGIDWAA